MRRGLELVAVAALAVGLVLVLEALVIKPYRIPSASMEPTLVPGQRILAFRLGLALRSPRRGDIVVFHPPVDTTSCADANQGVGADGRDGAQACDRVGSRESSTVFVKRIVGLPGDRLRIVGGRVFVDGRPEPAYGSVPCPGNSACDFPDPIVVPRGDYYQLGDNRGDSEDSRFWGPVPRAWLIGDVILSYWPLSRFGTL